MWSCGKAWGLIGSPPRFLLLAEVLVELFLLFLLALAGIPRGLLALGLGLLGSLLVGGFGLALASFLSGLLALGIGLLDSLLVGGFGLALAGFLSGLLALGIGLLGSLWVGGFGLALAGCLSLWAGGFLSGCRGIRGNRRRFA